MQVPYGISLGDLQALMAKYGAPAQQASNPYQIYQQMSRDNPAASSQIFREASGYGQLARDYNRDFKRLKSEAQRAGKQLLGANKSNKDYSQKSVGASFGGYDPRRAYELNFFGGVNAGAGPDWKSSQFMQDMLPYLDRYNQLRQQYEDRGYRPGSYKGITF
jgi:hypothetical protein